MIPLLRLLQHYSGTILTACALFPIVAAAFTLPFAVYQYRRYGGIPVIRVLIVYSFILYCMCAFLLTVLPLPSRQAVAAMGPKPVTWIPFEAMIRKMHAIGLYLSRPDTLKNAALWRSFLRSFELFQVLANVVMLVPFGFYLRSYFCLSLRRTVLAGFLVSLFFELTQLTGLFFYYPHAYRYAETGDLICNTLGALLGWQLAALTARLLPSRQTIDQMSYRKGRQVSRIRRLVSALLDLLLGAAFCWLLSRFAPWWTPGVCLPVLMAVLPALLRGSTAGQAAVKLRTVKKDGERTGFWRLAWRNLLLTLELFVPPACLGVIIAGAAGALSARTLPPRPVLGAMLLCTLAIAGLSALVLTTLRRWGELPHSRFSRTSVISYNTIPQEEPES